MVVTCIMTTHLTVLLLGTDLTISGCWEKVCACLWLQPDDLIHWVSMAVLDGGHLNRLAAFTCVPVRWREANHSYMIKNLYSYQDNIVQLTLKQTLTFLCQTPNLKLPYISVLHKWWHFKLNCWQKKNNIFHEMLTKKWACLKQLRVISLPLSAPSDRNSN